MLTVREIYSTIDTFAPFAAQESWDNSGLLVGSMTQPVKKVLTVLDISERALKHAIMIGADVIVSHHPVIFSPLRKLDKTHPVYRLAENGISAICVHTPLDMAKDGLNAYAHAMLQKPLSLQSNITPLEVCGAEGQGLGWVDTSSIYWIPTDLAKELQKAFGCACVRHSNWTKQIRKIAYCSGSGASLLEQAAEKGCDALITGDIKHDRWYAAESLDVVLFDCGHYETEQMAPIILKKMLQGAYPELDVYCMTENNPICMEIGGRTV